MAATRNPLSFAFRGVKAAKKPKRSEKWMPNWSLFVYPSWYYLILTDLEEGAPPAVHEEAKFGTEGVAYDTRSAEPSAIAEL